MLRFKIEGKPGERMMADRPCGAAAAYAMMRNRTVTFPPIGRTASLFGKLSRATLTRDSGWRLLPELEESCGQTSHD